MIERPVRLIDIKSSLIIKRPAVSRVIQHYSTIAELEQDRDLFSLDEYLGIYKNLKEYEIWNNANEKERQYLCPILKLYYNKNNVPILIVFRVEPLFTIEEAETYDVDESSAAIFNKLFALGYTDFQIAEIMENIFDICDKYGLDDELLLYDLTNIGYDNTLGLRILDYGRVIEQEKNN